MTIKNEAYWLEIESLEPFQEGAEGYQRNWEWLQKLQEAPLRQIDLIRLKAVLEAVFESGKASK